MASAKSKPNESKKPGSKPNNKPEQGSVTKPSRSRGKGGESSHGGRAKGSNSDPSSRGADSVNRH